MAERYRRPDWVRRLNAIADSVGGDARRIVPLDGSMLLAEAERSLDGAAPRGDFGDPAWRERFTKLADALDAAPMHVVGRLMMRQELLRALRTRLLLIGEVDAQPAIAHAPVVAPVIVTGPARSGTTILFELLALDPELRVPTAASRSCSPTATPGTRTGSIPRGAPSGSCSGASSSSRAGSRSRAPRWCRSRRSRSRGEPDPDQGRARGGPGIARERPAGRPPSYASAHDARGSSTGLFARAR